MKKQKIMQTCDVIIPVYNAPEYTKLCVYALFKNTDMNLIGKVIIINDNSNAVTTNMLNNIKEKYGEKIELIYNEKNQGFIKNVNMGFKMSKSDAVILLNTDVQGNK